MKKAKSAKKSKTVDANEAVVEVSVSESATASELTGAEAPPSNTKPALVFTLTGQEFKPARGLAHELFECMKTLGSATASQAADALIASGAYQRVAPRAAALRPVKPVATLLREWASKGAVAAS